MTDTSTTPTDDDSRRRHAAVRGAVRRRPASDEVRPPSTTTSTRSPKTPSSEAVAEEVERRRRPASDALDGATLDDAELLEIEEVPEPEPSPYDRPGRWYVVHTYAGYENKVKSNLASRVRSMNVEDRIFEVVIPMEDVIEFKNGRKVVVQKKVFPGYLLVRMGLDDDAWYVVRNTPGVTGFVGSGAKPTHLSRKEVEDILGTGEKIEGPAAEKKVRPRLEYEVAEQVRVVTGPFADFNGVDQRDRRRPLEAQGAREHLRSRDAGRARVRRRRQAVTVHSVSERSERTRQRASDREPVSRPRERASRHGKEASPRS